MASSATKPKKPVQLPPRGDWATAEQVGAYLGVSASAIYHGDAGTGGLRWAYLVPGAPKSPRRWYFPDVIALHKQRLEAATQFQVQMNAPLRMSRRRNRKVA